jgi:cytoskeleton protein RodZ
MTSLGEALRRERLRRNLELNWIAQELKIPVSMLNAIEEERFDKLPGGVFTRSFVRQYARVLELNENEILGELGHILVPEVEEPPANPPQTADALIPLSRMTEWQALRDPAARWSSMIGAGGLVIAAVVAAAGVYSLWQGPRIPLAPVRKAPAAIRPSAPPVEAAGPAAPVAESTPPAANEHGGAPAPGAPTAPRSADRVAAATGPVLAGGNSPAPPASSPTPAPEANPNAPVRVEVTADQATWISLRADGKEVFAGLLEAKQIQTAAANRNVRLRLGNAGGVSVRLNGQPIGAVGSKGSVRTVQLYPNGFKIEPADDFYY